jgi:hypothetical protein
VIGFIDSGKNVVRNQAVGQECREKSSSTFFESVSAQDDPGNCFNQLQLRWKMLRAHRDTDVLEDDHPAFLSKNSGIIICHPLEPARPHLGVRFKASSLSASLFIISQVPLP